MNTGEIEREIPLPDEFEREISQLDEFESEIYIPNDVLSELIFKFVPLCQWSSLELVSKQFRLCVLLAYRRIKLFNVGKLFSLKWTMTVGKFSRTPVTSGFHIQKTSTILNNVLTKLLSVCPNLTGLFGFEELLSVTDVETWEILKKFDHLESISFEVLSNKIAFQTFADFVASCKSLKHLTVGQNTLDIGGTLDVSSLSSVINVDARDLITFENFFHKLLASLQMCSFDRDLQSTLDANPMAICVNLESLSMRIWDETDYEVLFNALPNLHKLTNLTITGYYGDLDASFCMQLDSVKSQLQRLEFIYVDLSDEVQEFCFAKCSELQSLKFKSVLLSANVTKILPAKLQTLSFYDPDNSMLPIILPLLAELKNFTDLTITLLTSSDKLEDISCLIHLERLKIRSVVVDDSMLEKWDKKNDKMFGKLISLEIPYSKGISDVGGCLLAKKATNLQILNLRRSRIGKKTISTLADFAKKLTKVNLVQPMPFLFNVNHILRFVKKAFRLEKLTLNPVLAEDLARHKDFLPFAENVEINLPQPGPGFIIPGAG